MALAVLVSIPRNALRGCANSSTIIVIISSAVSFPDDNLRTPRPIDFKFCVWMGPGERKVMFDTWLSRIQVGHYFDEF